MAKKLLFWCIECRTGQMETWKDAMVNTNRAKCLQCGGTLATRRQHPEPHLLSNTPVKPPKETTGRRPGAEVRYCCMICVDCRTKFTSDDPPERDGNRLACSFCGGKIVLEHQLEDYLAEGFV